MVTIIHIEGGEPVFWVQGNNVADALLHLDRNKDDEAAIYDAVMNHTFNIIDSKVEVLEDVWILL